jgi:cytochrome c-type biogenesis protein CcmH/NrfG
MGDYVQARQNLMNALKIEPTNQSGMYLLAQIYYHEGNPQLAETWLLEAINHEIDPQNLGAWWMQLGDWRLEWNNCSGALEAYTNASTEGVNEEMMQKLKKLEELCKP